MAASAGSCARGDTGWLTAGSSLAGSVCFGFEMGVIVDPEATKPLRCRDPAGALLHDMSELVADQTPCSLARGIVFPWSDVNRLALGECTRAERSRSIALVELHRRKVGAERPLHVAAQTCFERRTRTG
jgi:hypothetical protein